MVKQFKFHCYEMQEIRECCSGCHNEWDYGYNEPMEWYFGKNITLSTCCGLGKYYDNKSYIIDLIKAARKYRRENAKKDLS